MCKKSLRLFFVIFLVFLQLCNVCLAAVDIPADVAPDITDEIDKKVGDNLGEIQATPEPSKGGKSKSITVEVKVPMSADIPENANYNVTKLADKIFHGDIGGTGGGTGGGDDETNDENKTIKKDEDSPVVQIPSQPVADTETVPKQDKGEEESSSAGDPYADVPELIQMQVEVGWDKKDMEKTLNKTIEDASKRVWSGEEGGLGGGTGGGDTSSTISEWNGVGGGTTDTEGYNILTHAESLLDSAVEFASEAFYGKGSTKKWGVGGTGGGIGGGTGDSAESTTGSNFQTISDAYYNPSKIVNVYFNGNNDYEIKQSKNDEGIYYDIYLNGKPYLYGLTDGRFILAETSDLVNNIRWDVFNKNTNTKNKVAESLFKHGLLEKVFAQSDKGSESFFVLSENTTGSEEAELAPITTQICAGMQMGTSYSCYIENPKTLEKGDPVVIDGKEVAKYGISQAEKGIYNPEPDPETGEYDPTWGMSTYMYTFVALDEDDMPLLDDKGDPFTFVMTDNPTYLSDEDMKNGLLITDPTGIKKMVYYSTKLNEENRFYGTPFVKEENREKIKTQIEEIKEVDLTSPAEDQQQVPTDINLFHHVNNALGLINENLFKPSNAALTAGNTVFNGVLTVSLTLVPLAILLSIAVAMRNGASSASGIANVREFIVDLIVSLGLAASSHFIIENTCKISSAIAGKIQHGDFTLPQDLMSGTDFGSGIVSLILGGLIIFVFVILVVALALAAMGFQAYYVLLCAFSPIMLIASSYKEFSGMKGQWFKMLMHLIMIAPANAIVCKVLSVL